MTIKSPFHVFMPKILQPWRCHDLIRLGKDNDGGYLVSHSDVMATEHLISFGIGCDWIFEQQFTDLAQCPLSAFDEKIPPQCHSGLLEFFQGPRKFTETKICRDGDPTGISIQQCCGAPNTFLKCDIEGGEYDIFNDILSMGDIWTGMALEIHNIDQWDRWNHLTDFLSKVPLKLIHMHVNNYGYWISDPMHIPWVLEITLGRGIHASHDPDLGLPHQLDQPNNPGDNEFIVSF